MSRELVECEHCKGQGVCTGSSGRSCRACLTTAGRGGRQWATVRCSYCGGIGRVWVETDEEDQEVSSDSES